MKKLILLLAIFVLLFSAISAPCQAQDQVRTLSTAEIDFPETITFKLEAQSAADITDVRLCYHVNKISPVWVFCEIKPDFEVAPKVEVDWTWQMKKSGGLPPGAEIQYWWIVRNAVGQELKAAPSTLEFEDHRHPWKSLSRDRVSLFWYSGKEAFALGLMEAAQGALIRLAEDTGTSLERPVKIYIYDSSSELLESLIHPEKWTGGVAFTEYGIVAIGVPEEGLAWGKRAVAHELTHLVTYQETFNPYNEIPMWLNEGISVYAEGEMDPYMKAILQGAIAEDELFSVRTLCSRFSARAREARLCYAQSYSLVKFLIETYGRDKMNELLGMFKCGSSYDQALWEVYRFDIDGLDARWRSAIGARSNLITPASTLPPWHTSILSQEPGCPLSFKLWLVEL